MKCDVLIIGAGPTGLMMAANLARQGISFRIIDEKGGPSSHSKALGIQARTLEILEQMDLINPFLEQGNKVRGISWYSGHEKLIHLSTQYIESPYPFMLILPQQKTEEIFVADLKERGAEVEWNKKLTHFTQTSEGVSATLESGEVIEASWILGCDGAHSAVRHILSIPFAGDSIDHTFYLADIEANWPISFRDVSIFFAKEGILAVFPIDKKTKTWRIVANLLNTKEPSTDEEIKALIHKRTKSPIPITNIIWKSPFKISYRLASQIQKGRAFLLGDALHIHSPVGGQGMNTGLQDAYNLAWKLALVIRGEAPSELLNSYSDERLQNAKHLLANTKRATKIIDSINPVVQLIRTHFIPSVLSVRPVQKFLINSIGQVSLSYKKSSYISDIGTRFPLQDFKTLKGPTFHLFCNDPSLKSAIQKSYSKLITVHDEGADNTLFFVRPDGYIAYHASPYDKAQFLNYLKTLFSVSQGSIDDTLLQGRTEKL